MSLTKRSDVKNHLSTRTGGTALPARSATDTGPSGKSADGGKDEAFASSGVASTDKLASPASSAEKQKA